MQLFSFAVLAIFVADIGTLQGKPSTTAKDPGVTSTARIMQEGPVDGSHRSLHKQDIEKLGKGDHHRLRLHFDNAEWPPLDMRVTQGSVWSRDSVVTLRKGPHKVQMPHALDGNCFLRGRLVGHEGTVTINRCGRMSGNIHTSGHHYKIEEHETTGEDGSMGHTMFKVTKRRHERDAEDDKNDEEAVDMVKQKAIEALEQETYNRTTRTKRKVHSVTVELVAYLDANYVDHLYFERDLDTADLIRDFIITKWDTVQGVYSDPEVVGASLTIALKRIEIWWNNPDGYPDNSVGVSGRLGWFCRNTPETDHFDMKALYTKNVEGHQLGLAYTGHTCVNDYNCFLAKSPTENVRVEVHEFGHCIGFRHDPDIPNCDPEGGFMGWDETSFRYLPCYKRVLQSKLRSRRFDCLFETNVPDDDADSDSSLSMPPTSTPHWFLPDCNG